MARRSLAPGLCVRAGLAIAKKLREHCLPLWSSARRPNFDKLCLFRSTLYRKGDVAPLFLRFASPNLPLRLEVYLLPPVGRHTHTYTFSRFVGLLGYGATRQPS